MFLICNGTVVTRSPKGECIPEGAVAVDSGCIAAVGSRKELLERFPDAEEIDARGGLIMPALIDADTSSFSTVLSLALPQTRNPFDPCAAYNDSRNRLLRRTELSELCSFSRASAVSCIKNGVGTVFLRHPGNSCISGSLSTIASAFRGAGLRLCLGLTCSTLHGENGFASGIDEALDFRSYCAALGIDTLRHSFSLYSAGLTERMLSDFSAASGDGFIDIAFSQSMTEHSDDYRSYRMTPFERMNSYGLFGGRTRMIDCSLLTSSELLSAAGSGASVVVSAASDLVKGALPPDPSELLKAGARLLIGTGDAGTDVLDSAKAYLLFAAAKRGLTDELVGLVTKALFINNASLASLRFGRRIGVIEPGAAADITVIDVPVPSFDGASIDRQLLLNACGACCSTVFVSGKPVMIDRKPMIPDVERIASGFIKAVEKLR